MRRWSSKVFVVAAVAALATLTFAGTASAGRVEIPNQLTIVKVVSGPVTADTAFTVSVVCDNDIIEGGDTDSSATVKFDSKGQPTTDSVINFRLGTDQLASCTVTETVNGGASSTTFACEDDTVETDAVVPPVEEVCPQTGPVEKSIIVNKSLFAIDATVTVTNTFVPKPVDPVTPAASVVAQPAFTG